MAHESRRGKNGTNTGSTQVTGRGEGRVAVWGLVRLEAGRAGIGESDLGCPKSVIRESGWRIDRPSLERERYAAACRGGALNAPDVLVFHELFWVQLLFSRAFERRTK